LPTKLKNLFIKTLGSVDRPANGEASVVLLKRDGGDIIDIAKIASGVLSRVVKTEGAMDFNTVLWNRQLDDIMWEMTRALSCSIESILNDASLTDKDSAIALVLQQFYTALVGSGITHNALTTLTNKVEKAEAGSGMSEEMRSMMKDILTAMANAMMSKELTVNKKEGTQLPDKISIDQLPEDVRKRLEKLEELEKKAAKVDELETKLQKSEEARLASEELAKKERDERITKEFIAKAAEYKGLSVGAAELGPILKGISEKAPDEYAKLEPILKAASEAIQKGNLFKEHGTGGEASSATDALSKLNQIASEMVQKNAGMTREQAFAKAVEQNPDLYRQYRSETQRFEDVN
jgi:TolA-binding protein